MQLMWIIRRLKELGRETADLVDVLRQQVVSVLEQAVPYWAPLIIRKESNMIACILKTGLHVIFQDDYHSFENVISFIV